MSDEHAIEAIRSCDEDLIFIYPRCQEGHISQSVLTKKGVPVYFASDFTAYRKLGWDAWFF
jgi:hypothetical protein